MNRLFSLFLLVTLSISPLVAHTLAYQKWANPAYAASCNVVPKQVQKASTLSSITNKWIAITSLVKGSWLSYYDSIKKMLKKGHLFLINAFLDPKNDNLGLICPTELDCPMHTEAQVDSLTVEARCIMNKALSYELIRDLYNLVTKTPNCYGETGEYTLEIVDYPVTGFEASCCINRRAIEVRSDLSDEKKLSYFVFELINAKTAQKHLQLYLECCRSQITPEQYAKASEQLEFENTIEHANIIRLTGLGSAYDLWGQRSSKDFENVWNSYLKYSSHADYWRNAGREAFGSWQR